MKKIKLILLILIVITCTGCSVEYNININENNIEESIYVTDHISSIRTKKDILNHYNMWYPTYVNFITEGETIEVEDFNEKIDGIEYHNKNITELNNGYKYVYNYIYPIDKYYDSYVLASTFIETSIHRDSEKIVLRTGKKNLLCQYDYFENVKINIKIDPEIYKLNYTNSNNIENNTYTWILNKNNCDDSQIILTLNKKEDNEEIDLNIKNKNNKENGYIFYIFLITIILIIYLGYKWFLKFKEKNNDIE